MVDPDPEFEKEVRLNALLDAFADPEADPDAPPPAGPPVRRAQWVDLAGEITLPDGTVLPPLNPNLPNGGDPEWMKPTDSPE